MDGVAEATGDHFDVLRFADLLSAKVHEAHGCSGLLSAVVRCGCGRCSGGQSDRDLHHRTAEREGASAQGASSAQSWVLASSVNESRWPRSVPSAIPIPLSWNPAPRAGTRRKLPCATSESLERSPGTRKISR